MFLGGYRSILHELLVPIQLYDIATSSIGGGDISMIGKVFKTNQTQLLQTEINVNNLEIDIDGFIRSDVTIIP